MEAMINIKTGEAMADKSKPQAHHTALDRLFRYAEFLNFGEVHIKFDHATGLRAIIAVHNLKRGPAIGGCRLIQYASADDALEDALRLGQMMSLKAAVSNLAHGGAKAVLMKPKVIKDRTAYLQAFGDFVNQLGGRYITAVDSGTHPGDMDIVKQRTPYVTCTTANGDPSPSTALGVCHGIDAAVKFKMNRDNLKGIHVSIQGVGHVGYYLAKDLAEKGARLTVCDVNEENVQRCIQEFGAEACAPDAIYDVEADVFAPCALGAVLNLQTIKRLRVSIVAGSANNQLAHHHHGALMQEQGILYAPDFVINAGGLIYVAGLYDHSDPEQAKKQVSGIGTTLSEIFQRAQDEKLSTNQIAEKMAIEKLKAK